MADQGRKQGKFFYGWWIVIGGLLNFAAGLPIHLSFKKGIFYGVQ